MDVYKSLLLLCILHSITKTLGATRDNYSPYKKIIYQEKDNDSECVCFEKNPLVQPVSEVLDPLHQGIVRLVIYFYRLPSGVTYSYIPNSETQAILPDIHFEKGETLKEIPSEQFDLLIFNNKQPKQDCTKPDFSCYQQEKVKDDQNPFEEIVNPKPLYPGGIVQGIVELNYRPNISPDPDIDQEPSNGNTNDSLSNAAQENPPNENDENVKPTDIIQKPFELEIDDEDRPNDNPAQHDETVPSDSIDVPNEYGFNNENQPNNNPIQPGEIIPSDSLHVLYEYGVNDENRPNDNPVQLDETIPLDYIPKAHELGKDDDNQPINNPGSDTNDFIPNQAQHDEIIPSGFIQKPFEFDISALPFNTNLTQTFTIWFNEQMNKVQKDHHCINSKVYNKSTLELIVKETLKDHGVIVSSGGILIDEKGNEIDMTKLHLRSLLIGDTVEYSKIVSNHNKTFVFPTSSSYLETILLTFNYPPEVIAIIPVGKLDHPKHLESELMLNNNFLHQTINSSEKLHSITDTKSYHELNTVLNDKSVKEELSQKPFENPLLENLNKVTFLKLSKSELNISPNDSHYDLSRKIVTHPNLHAGLTSTNNQNLNQQQFKPPDGYAKLHAVVETNLHQNIIKQPEDYKKLLEILKKNFNHNIIKQQSELPNNYNNNLQTILKTNNNQNVNNQQFQQPQDYTNLHAILTPSIKDSINNVQLQQPPDYTNLHAILTRNNDNIDKQQLKLPKDHKNLQAIFKTNNNQNVYMQQSQDYTNPHTILKANHNKFGYKLQPQLPNNIRMQNVNQERISGHTPIGLRAQSPIGRRNNERRLHVDTRRNDRNNSPSLLSPLLNRIQSTIQNIVPKLLVTHKLENSDDDEDDGFDFRIIGGSAAMGSGSPINNRGRSRYYNYLDRSK